MIFLIILLLIVFCVLFTFVWVWFYKNTTPAVEDFYKTGIKAFEKGEFKKAKEAFTKVDKTNPNLADAEYKLGIVQVKLQEYSDATVIFEKILKTAPKNVSALFNMAQALQFQGKYDEAQEFYNKALDENDKNWECYLNIGIINLKKEDYKKAIETLEKAKEISPENTQILFQLTNAKSEICDMEDSGAIEGILNQYMEISKNPNPPKELSVSMAKFYAKTGDIDKALEFCRKALELNDKDMEAYKLLGLILMIKKEFTEAKNTLSTALHLQPNNKELHDILAYLLCQEGDECEREKCRLTYHEMMQKYLK